MGLGHGPRQSLAVYHDDRAVDVADQAVAQQNVRNFSVASLPDAWRRADGGDARGFASRLSSEGLVHQLRQFGLALPDGHQRPDAPFRKQRARYLVEVMFAAVHESGSVQLAQSGQSGMSRASVAIRRKTARNARYELFSP